MRIFYSWQSDLPSRTNYAFIDKALASAATLMKGDGETDTEPVIDQDIEGLTGAPHIAKTIFDRIYLSDAFVCDVSIIGLVSPKIQNAAGRPTPNPNVLAELGYAVGVLGWERVVLVFNEAFGALKDLPFDLDRNRTMKYHDPDSEHERAATRKALAADLAAALRTIRDADQAGQLPPTLRSFRVAEIRDSTHQRIVTIPHDLGRMNAVLQWELGDADLSRPLSDVREAAEKLRRLPRQAASLLSVLLSRAETYSRKGFPKTAKSLNYNDARHATELSVEMFKELTGILEQHGCIWVEPDDDGTLWIRWRDVCSSGWPILGELKVYSETTGIPLSRFLVDLRFDLLDEQPSAESKGS